MAVGDSSDTPDGSCLLWGFLVELDSDTKAFKLPSRCTGSFAVTPLALCFQYTEPSDGTLLIINRFLLLRHHQQTQPKNAL